MAVPTSSCARQSLVLPTLTCLIAAAILLAFDRPAWAQDSAPTPPQGYRKLAPGAEILIPSKPDPQDTVTQHDMVEITSAGEKLDWKPETQSSSSTLKVLTKDIPFRRGAWYLEIACKPLRMIEVDFPLPDGRMDRRTVWYVLYRVKNLGGHLQPAEGGKKTDGPPATTSVDYPVYFFPQFVLESDEYKKAYLDRVLPLAVDAIRKREDPNRKLLDSIEISQQPIPLSPSGEDHSVWGVATWTDVDPKIDFFSIYVKGLTNAYRFVDPPDAYQQGQPPGSGRQYGQKTLKLRFWRPGDQYEPNEREFYFGTPGKVDHEWVFR